MGFFEFLTSGDKSRDDTKKRKKSEEKKQAESKSANQNAFESHGINLTSSNSTIDIFKPKSFDDVAKIIDNLCGGSPAIVHLGELSDGTAQRVIDLLSGAVYAINGNLCELEKDVYIFTPNGVRVN